MSATFNDTQLEILKVLNFMKDPKDLTEIKSLLVAWLSDKVVRNADEAFEENNYTEAVFENWKKEHFRKSSGG